MRNIIRTRGNPLKSSPHPLLAVTSLLAVSLAILLPFTALGTYFGFVPLPPSYFGVLALLVISYLVVVQVIKHQFYAHR